jgi:hypothetical protein
MNHDESVRYLAAKERVEQLRGFYVHLTVYVLVNLFLFGLNIATDRDNLWFFWPLLGWGIGLAAHAMTVFVFDGTLGKNWQERQISELMDKDRRSSR